MGSWNGNRTWMDKGPQPRSKKRLLTYGRGNHQKRYKYNRHQHFNSRRSGSSNSRGSFSYDRRPLTSSSSSSHSGSSHFGSIGADSPLGIANLGNTCYLAAALQCLLRVPTLRKYLLRREHSRRCGARGSGFCVLCELEEFVGKTRIKKHQDRTISTTFGLRPLRIGGVCWQDENQFTSRQDHILPLSKKFF